MECPVCYESPTCKWGMKCHYFGNPGFGHHGFDNMAMAIHAVFIMMTNLYWWETAFQLEDGDQGLASNIAWLFGLIVVFVLSWVAINMFVAGICNGYNEVQEEQGMVYDETEGGANDEEDITAPPDYSCAWGNVSGHKLLAEDSVADGKETDTEDTVCVVQQY